MNEEEIVSNNKLIAEFMGAKRSRVDGKGKWMRFPEIVHGHYSFRYNNLQYHSSWDWIHPAYRKIAEIGLWMMTNGHDKLWLEKSKEIEYAIFNEETPEKASVLISQFIK